MRDPTFILDYDGTLCDTLAAITDSLVITFRHFDGVAPAVEDIRALVGTGKTVDETIRRLLPQGAAPLDDDAVRARIAFYRGQYGLHAEAKVRLFEGVAECLDRLRALGKLVLVSNKGLQAVQASLRHFGIADHFQLVLAEEAGQARKPHPDVFSKRIATKLPGIAAEDCIVVGDTATDLEFAKNIGAQSCLARYGYGDAAECEAIGYTHAIRRISDLLEIYAPDEAIVR